MLFQVAELEVVIPPQISDKLSTEDLSVREGSSAKFICSATGHPQPTITWQKMPNGPREKPRIRVTNDKGKETHRKTVHGEVLDIGKNQCCQLLVKKFPQCYQLTELKFHDFCIIQILREINFKGC